VAKKTTLEDFVKNYVQSKKNSESDEDYRKWLKTNGIDSGAIYDESIKDITADYAKAKSEYGALGESLGNLGLTASGYSDYLNGKAYSEMQKRKAGARGRYIKNEAENRKGYGEYLSNLAKTEAAEYENTVNEIISSGIMDFDEAYELAIGKGLNEASAELAAKAAGDSVRKKVRENALKTIVSQNFGKTQAKEYALALGLSEAEADELADYANKINRDNYYSSDYLQYLKDKWAKEGEGEN